MSQKTREEVLAKLRQRYKSAGKEHKQKLLNQAQELLGYHRKSAIRALRAPVVERGPRIVTGRTVTYEPGVLVPTLRKIWEASDFVCGSTWRAERTPRQRLWLTRFASGPKVKTADETMDETMVCDCSRR